MTSPLRTFVPFILSFVVVFSCAAGVQPGTELPPRDTTLAVGPPTLSIESPASGAAVQGVAIVRFRAENVRIVSPFRLSEAAPSPLPPAHLDVTVDGAEWHWVHATSDPVVITPLPPGEHTVALELAGADHRPLVARSVRFTVVAKAVAGTEHAGRH